MFAFLGCFLFLWGTPASASQLNFSVNPVIPENQQDKDKSYFDLKIEPGQEQVLTVVLKNGTDKEVEIETSISRATTNLNGVVEYGKTKDKKDASLVHNLEDFVKLPEKNTIVPANGEKELLINVTAPANEFEGILTGGLTFKEVNGVTEKEKESSGLAIKNEYAYVVGLVLHGTNENMPSDIKLTSVGAAQVNARNVINATLQNPKAKYLNQLAINATVTKKGSTEILYSAKKDNMQMAPNSHFNFPISLDGQPLKAGTYTVTMKATSLEDSWELTKDFTIEKEQADKLNAQDVSIKEDNTWIYIAIGVGVLVLLGIILFLIYRHKRKERLKKERMKRKKQERQRRRKQQEKEKARQKVQI